MKLRKIIAAELRHVLRERRNLERGTAAFNTATTNALRFRLVGADFVS